LQEALERGDAYDMVVADYRLPDGDALEFARTIRSDVRLRRLRLILITALDAETRARDSVAAGYDVFLVKPVRQSQLYNAVVDLTEGRAVAARVQAPAAKPESVRAERILLVEDNPVNQRLAVKQLEKLGFEPALAANGREAVDAWAETPFDLIFMDVQMPEMDGFEATGEIRRRENGGKHVPIVAMTANARPEDRVECLAAGMDDHLSKPVTLGDLRAVIDRWLAVVQP
jgi:CheY-like chemotaxis protein